MSARAPEWYHDGLRFECTCCGECCTGAEGYVRVSDEDCAKIARLLDLTEEEFIERYTHPMKLGMKGRSLNEHKTEFGYDCVFLDRKTDPDKALCSIHEHRPQQCRTWPFWPENIKSPRAWQRTSRSCEGINRGPVHSLQQIRVLRDETPA